MKWSTKDPSQVLYQACRASRGTYDTAMSRTALITGASSGIGQELATLFAAHGHDLILVARRGDRLRALGDTLGAKHGIRADTIAMDLSEPASARVLADAVTAKGLQVDVLVNNAGFGRMERFADSDPAINGQMIELNIATLTALCRLFLPGMLARREGRILNVASTAAFQPGPHMAVYFATKAFVLALGEAMAEELRGSGVTVTTLCPGPTHSEFQQRARITSAPVFRAPWVMSSPRVARLGYRGLIKGRVVVVAGWVNRLLVAALRCTPRWVVRRAVARLQQQ